MNLQLMYTTIQRKAIFFVATEEIEKQTEEEKAKMEKFLADNYLKIEPRSEVMCVIKKDLEALLTV